MIYCLCLLIFIFFFLAPVLYGNIKSVDTERSASKIVNDWRKLSSNTTTTKTTGKKSNREYFFRANLRYFFKSYNSFWNYLFSKCFFFVRLQVDFEDMKQYKPKEMEIRRSFQSGLWIQYMQSPHEQQLHMKVNHFQIDNQLPVCVFPTVFAPVPPAKSVAAESIPKPFTEVSFIMRKAEHSNIPQIK